MGKGKREYRVLHLSWRNKVARSLWSLVWLIMYRPSPTPLHWWRRLLLRSFGAQIQKGAHPYPSARVWAPWNLTMGKHSCLSHFVDCYCVDKIEIGDYATISQYSYLCTATHDYNQRDMPLITSPIQIGSYAWITADVFVGPGVTIGEGAVIGARSTIYHNIDPWAVVAGNPPKLIRMRNPDSILSGEP